MCKNAMCFFFFFFTYVCVGTIDIQMVSLENVYELIFFFTNDFTLNFVVSFSLFIVSLIGMKSTAIPNSHMRCGI